MVRSSARFQALPIARPAKLFRQRRRRSGHRALERLQRLFIQCEGAPERPSGGLGLAQRHAGLGHRGEIAGPTPLFHFCFQGLNRWRAL
jgi:hypothetical protein